MGTNYYALFNICPCCQRPEKEMHIGKRSGGWRFNFYGDEQIRSWEDWQKALAMPQSLIRNEYGEHVTLSELKEIVDSTRKYETELYFKGEPTEWTDEEGFRFWDREFC